MQVQIALADLFRGLGQPPDRSRQPVGEPQAQPHRLARVAHDVGIDVVGPARVVGEDDDALSVDLGVPARDDDAERGHERDDRADPHRLAIGGGELAGLAVAAALAMLVAGPARKAPVP